MFQVHHLDCYFPSNKYLNLSLNFKKGSSGATATQNTPILAIWPNFLKFGLFFAQKWPAVKNQCWQH